MVLSKQRRVHPAWRESRGSFGDGSEVFDYLGAFLANTLVGLGLAIVAAGCCEPHHAQTDHPWRYNKPLVSSGAYFAALPPAVQNTVRAEAGSAGIEDVIKDTSSGQLIYQIHFEKHETYPPLNVAPDGSVLDDNLLVAIKAPEEKSKVVTGGTTTGISLGDLPAAVVKGIQREAPDAEVDTIFKEVSRDQTTYIVTFKDHRHGALRLAADGTVVP